MPGDETEVKATEISKNINFSSGKYGTYVSSQKNCQEVIDTTKASELQYATVNFESVKLSEYSVMGIEAYLVKDPANPWKAGGRSKIAGTEILGAKELKNFSWQVPVSASDGYLFINVYINSAGQINTDMNDGYVLKDVVGVLKDKTSATGESDNLLTDVKVEWSKVDASYTLPVNMSENPWWPEVVSNVYTEISKTYPKPAYSCEYSVPTYPQTGNAIIKVYDSNKKIVAYYAVPTENKKDANGVYQNVNVIKDDAANLYQISKAEAENMVGTVTTDANGNAVINSKETGITHVQGIITSSNDNVKIDVTNNKIYSSVQWNPIPNAGTTTPTGTKRTPVGAFIGQTITFNAQLKDRNGNDVTTSDVGVKFKYYDTTQKKELEINTVGQDLGGATVVSVDTKTDATGKAKLVLIAANPAQLVDVAATTAQNYSLAYTLGSEQITGGVVDIYWLDADLAFLDKPNGTTTETSAADAYKTTANTLIQPSAGSNWEYGVYTVPSAGGLTFAGSLTGYGFDSIDGMSIQTSVGSDSVGTVTEASDGKAKVTSTKAGSTYLVNAINSTSVGKNVTFTFKGTNKEDKVLPCVGEGTAVLDKQLTLNINWKTTTATATMIIPTGGKAVEGTTVNAYVKVVDTLGNAISGKTVTLANPAVGTLKTTTATTDTNGIAAFEITGGNAGESTTLSATVDGINGMTAIASIKWVDNPANALNIASATYDYSTKTLTVKFNKDIQSSSVVKGLFTVKVGTAEQILGDVKVNGKTVTITLPALANLSKSDKMTVEVNDANTDATVGGIQYTLSATDGESLSNIGPENVTIK